MKNVSNGYKNRSLLGRVVIIGMIFAIALGSLLYVHIMKSEIQAPKVLSIDLGDGIIMEFVRIDSGSFMMGSYEGEGDSDETPRHKVTITKSFYIGTYEVTQEQWEKVMRENPSEWKGKNYPIDTVSWNDCMEFTEKLSEITSKEFTLPTEAQWEYACRAGTTTKWFFGNNVSAYTQYGWMDEEAQGTSHQVGLKTPNPWGIYDMYGNIQEWCLDWYQNPYLEGDSVDPTGPNVGDSRVIRGGGWGDLPDNARSAYRNAIGEDIANNGTGFRCVLKLD